MPGLNPRACTHYPNSARLINEFFFVTPKPNPSGPAPKSQTQKSVQTQNHKSQNIHVIFLASKQMPRSNKSICTKNPTNPKNKISNSENSNNKTPKNPTNLAYKKKPQTQILLTKTWKEKNLNHTDCGSVVGEGWFTVDL